MALESETLIAVFLILLLALGLSLNIFLAEIAFRLWKRNKGHQSSANLKQEGKKRYQS